MKYAVLVGLGDYYKRRATRYAPLPFVYKNVENLATKLSKLGWTVPPALLNEVATKDHIIEKLSDAEKATKGGDTILFYFTGHGDRFFNSSRNNIEHYLVSAIASTTDLQTTAVKDFFSEISYDDVIRKFDKTDRHLITIIDCCYAFGLIEGYQFQQDFHTVIASSAENAPTFYNSNSLFFQAFAKSWDAKSLTELRARIQNEMIQLESPTLCKIFLASKYLNTSLT